MMIGLFLAMLELIRNKLIWAEQPDLNGPIYLKPLTSEPAEEAVHNAIYASPEAMEQAVTKTVDAEPEVSIEENFPSTEEDEESEIDAFNMDNSMSIDGEARAKTSIRIMELPPQSPSPKLNEARQADSEKNHADINSRD